MLSPEPAVTVPTVIIEWERFVGWLLDRTEKFPKRATFTFRTRLDNLALDIYERLVEARYARDKASFLQRVNMDLTKLRLLLRLCHDQRLLDGRAFAHACDSIEAVGRMVGGWLRQQAAR